MLETMEILHPYITEDNCTICKKGCCQHHDVPLPHSRNSPNKEYDQSEDRKSSMNSNFGNRRPEFANCRSQVRSIKFQVEEQRILEFIQNIILLRTNLGGYNIRAHLISTFPRLDDPFLLKIDNSIDQSVRKSVNFLFLDLKGYTNFPCNGIQGSRKFHSTGLLRLKVFKYPGIRQCSSESHIEGFQTSRTLHSAGPRKSDKSHSYRSESMTGSKTCKSAGKPKLDNSHSERTEDLHRSKTLLDESLNRSQTLHSEGLRTSEQLYSHSCNDSTHPSFKGTRGINSVLQITLQALILQISMVLKSVGHFVILMVLIPRAVCTDDQVVINCTTPAVITSPNYPSTYSQIENVEWSVTAPEGRRILLTFNTFSLGPLGDVKVIDNVIGRKRQNYGGAENTIPPFLSRGNSLVLRFTSDGNPTGDGFNISASCYDLSETRVGRLMGGKTPAEGFLELQAESGSEWMRVCEEHSADRVAKVVCGELGFAGAKEVSYGQGECSSERADPGCIRAPRCENHAYRSQDCSDSSEKCTSSRAVEVKCFEPGFKGCYDLRDTRLQNGFSYDSTSQCITSCRADTSQAMAIINGSECFCSTSDDIGLSSFSQVETQSCALHQFVYNATVGFCNQMDDVTNGSWDSNITWFGSIVHLTCDDGYSLNGSGTLQCVTEVSSYLFGWNGSIPTCEMVTDSTPRTSGETTPTHDSETKRQINAAMAISSSMSVLISIICAVACDQVSTGME